MAPGPKATALVLGMEERAALGRIARRRKAGQAPTTRARVVLACAEPGANDMGVARALSVSRPIVATWRARFAAHRMEGWTTHRAAGRLARSGTRSGLKLRW